MLFSVLSVRWYAERTTPFAGRDQRRQLHALRIRVENPGASPVDASALGTVVETSSGRDVEADPLVDLDELEPGGAVEGWCVVTVRDAEVPVAFVCQEPSDARYVWALEADA